MTIRKCDNTQELDLETLIKRHWLRKLCLLYEIEKSTFLSYLFRLIPNMSWVHIARNSNNLKDVNLQYGFFKNSFFSICDNGTSWIWKFVIMLHRDPWKRKQILNFIGVRLTTIFKLLYFHIPLWIKPVAARVRVAVSHFKKSKCKYNLHDSISLSCNCGAASRLPFTSFPFKQSTFYWPEYLDSERNFFF